MERTGGASPAGEMTGCDMYQVYRHWQLTRSSPFAGDLHGTFRGRSCTYVWRWTDYSPGSRPLRAMVEGGGRSPPNTLFHVRNRATPAGGGWTQLRLWAWLALRPGGRQPTDLGFGDQRWGAACAQPLGSHPRGPRRGRGIHWTPRTFRTKR